MFTKRPIYRSWQELDLAQAEAMEKFNKACDSIERDCWEMQRILKNWGIPEWKQCGFDSQEEMDNTPRDLPECETNY